MSGPSGFMQAPKPPEPEQPNTPAFRAGQASKRRGDKLEQSGIRNLRFGSQQYEDFIAGYDSEEVSK